MAIKNIFTFGDGYAANHIWPEWPAIVQALYPELSHKNFGEVGAGDEFITTAVVETHQKNPDAFYIVQWGIPQRFDKLLQDNSWDDIIDNDPSYHFNRVTLYEKTWWLSSASRQPPLDQYHLTYIQTQQAQTRSQNFQYLVEKLLKNQSLFFDLTQMRLYAESPRFKTVRQDQIQPSPIVHMCWVEDKILPKMPYQPKKDRLTELKNRINHHNWQPYDPDREEIWTNLSAI
jgi:hypothetical protein